MKRTLALLAVAAAVLAVGVPAGTATTAPGYNFKIKVTITKGGQVTMSSLLAKRGWLAHFLVTNKDVRAHRFDVGGRGPKTPIAPGKTVKIGAYLGDRGQFAYRVDGKVRGYFVVN